MNDPDSATPGIDDDPAAPLAGEGSIENGTDAALTNFGEEGPLVFPSVAGLAVSILAVDYGVVLSFLHDCMTSVPRVGYHLGSKVPTLTAKPGVDFINVDCSGFVRATIRRSTNPPVAFPDGSVNQHDWVAAKGFAQAVIADGALHDGKVRIAFLSPADTDHGIGHVVLIRNGATAESHGGVGPDTRLFNGTGWQAKAKLFVLNN